MQLPACLEDGATAQRASSCILAPVEYTAPATSTHRFPGCCPSLPTCRYGEGLVDIGSDENGVVDADEIVMSAT